MSDMLFSYSRIQILHIDTHFLFILFKFIFPIEFNNVYHQQPVIRIPDSKF